jgi:hypothetical protein
MVSAADGESATAYGGCVYAGEVYAFYIAGTDADGFYCNGETQWIFHSSIAWSKTISGGAIVYSTQCACNEVLYIRVDEHATQFSISAAFEDEVCPADDPDFGLELEFDVVCHPPAIKLEEPVSNESANPYRIVSVRSTVAPAQGQPAVRFELHDNEEMCQLVDMGPEKESPDECDLWYVYRAKLIPGTEPGDGEVKVYAETTSGCCDEILVELCGSCKNGNCAAGEASIQDGSVDVRFNLGRGARGDSVGALRIYGRVPSDALSSPAGLQYDYQRADVTMHVYSDWGEIIAPEVWIMIPFFEPNSNTYQLEFYTPGWNGLFTTYT